MTAGMISLTFYNYYNPDFWIFQILTAVKKNRRQNLTAICLLYLLLQIIKHGGREELALGNFQTVADKLTETSLRRGSSILYTLERWHRCGWRVRWRAYCAHAGFRWSGRPRLLWWLSFSITSDMMTENLRGCVYALALYSKLCYTSRKKYAPA